MTEPARTRYLVAVDVDHGEGHAPPAEVVAATLTRRTAGVTLNDGSGHQAPAAWGIRPSVVEVLDSPTAGYLTADEHEAMRLSAELASTLRRVIGEGDQAAHSWTECARSIHDLQARVMAQAAARAYPDLYRPLGGWPT